MKNVQIRRYTLVLFVQAALVLAGCGVVYTPILHTAAAQYRAYGDSITYGYSLSDPLTQAYPALVSDADALTFADNALSANQVCDVAATQIFPNEDSPTLASHPTYTLLIGTNDALFEGAGAYEAVFRLCHQAAISWFALPAEYKVLANQSGASSTGAGELDTTNHWNAWSTEGLGSTVSFAITMSAAGPIYAWPMVDDNSTGTYSYSLDGVVIGTGTMQTTPKIATHIGTTRSLGFLRLPTVPAGKHVVTFTQTSDGSEGVSVVGVGTPTGPASNKLPTVLAGTIPFHLQQPGDTCNTPDGDCAHYIQDIEADVDFFTADGLDVRLFDTRKFMFGTAAEMNDTLHPNKLGQMELSHAVEGSW